MNKRFFALLCVLCGIFPAFSLTAQEIFCARKIDWEKGEVTLTLSSALAQSGPNRPAAVITAERRIDTSLPRIFSEALLPVQIDSLQRFEEAVENGDFPAAELLTLSMAGKKNIPRYAQDMQSVSIDYTYRLHDILAAYFVRHKQAMEIPRFISWIPTTEYTGIVIYADASLPVHGEDAESSVVPCLFPEIFDEEMNPVFSLEMGDPAYLKRWGSAAYASSFDEAPWKHRIGERPMRIIARGLYGKYPTDLKISPQDAARILALPENRRLLAEGRVLIISEVMKD
ncbi:MAG: hypothetical protein LBT68_07700 [Spirochaetales bacterium]|jgi:hypothetical protein|nr:hypothetical protein [Spirochaetales bacterium]